MSYEDELIKSYASRIKQLTDEISKLKKDRKAALELLMDLDCQVMKAIDFLEKLNE